MAREWMVMLIAEDSEVEVVDVWHIDPIVKAE